MSNKFVCKDFDKNSSKIFSDLYHSSKFSDVTLVCVDKTQFKAHKFILCTYSSVFENILQDGKLDCIYLQGISNQEIESILQFLYYGEAIVPEERSADFQNSIDSLKIKSVEVSADKILSLNKKADINPTNLINEKTTKLKMETEKEQKEVINNEEKTLENLGVKSVTESVVKCDYASDSATVYNTEVEETKKNNVQHQKKLYKCDKCNYQTKCSSNLTKHVKGVHEKVKYNCKQCSIQASHPSNLILHVKAKHQGLLYFCDLCDYSAQTQQQLEPHKNFVHKGIRYPCKECGFQAGSPFSFTEPCTTCT